MPRVASPAAAHVGEQIRIARLKASMTHDALAAASGIDSSNVRSYESGRAMPNVHTLVRLAAAVGTDPGTLLDGLTLAHFETVARERRAG